MSWKNLNNGSTFGNVGWDYYHRKPKISETNTGMWCVNENLQLLVECFISLEMSWKVMFWKTLTETINIKNLKLTSNMVCISEKFL